MPLKLVLIFVLFTCIVTISSHPSDNNINHKGPWKDYLDKIKKGDLVRVDLFYETLCPDCIAQYPEVVKLYKKLGHYVDLYTYPYGNAKIKVVNGKKIVECQHGEAECYGNKLHACAIDILKDLNVYLDYNECLINKNSNDTAAYKCAEKRKINSRAIKKCAKGKKGQNLLVHYGEISEKIHFDTVPYVLFNGIARNIDEPDLIIRIVCKLLKDPPKECSSYSVESD